MQRWRAFLPRLTFILTAAAPVGLASGWCDIDAVGLLQTAARAEARAEARTGAARTRSLSSAEASSAVFETASRLSSYSRSSSKWGHRGKKERAKRGDEPVDGALPLEKLVPEALLKSKPYMDAVAREVAHEEPSRRGRHRRHRRRKPPGEYEPYRQTLVNFGDAQYISYMTLGHQLIGGILDTGSFELVVFSSVCATCGHAAEYNPWLSSSYKVGFFNTKQSYGSGDTFSQEAFDLVSIGPYADREQSFWEVTSASMPILQDAAFQAIIGVGPPETPSTDAWSEVKTKTGKMWGAEDIANMSAGNFTIPPDSEVPASLVTEWLEEIDFAMEVSKRTTMLRTFNVSIFSVCFGKKPQSDGYFIWNDDGPFRHHRLFSEVPVVGAHTWSVQLKNVRLEGGRYQLGSSKDPNVSSELGCSGGCSAILDTGTSLLAVPGPIIERLNEMMEEVDDGCSNLDVLPDLVFEAGEGVFYLSPDSYVAQVVGPLPKYFGRTSQSEGSEPAKQNGCQLLLMESYAKTQYGPLWILGMPFFRNYYTSFKVSGEKQDRRVYMSHASEDCHAEAAAKPKRRRRGGVSLLQQGSRAVDASRVTLAHWAQKANEGGYWEI